MIDAKDLMLGSFVQVVGGLGNDYLEEVISINDNLIGISNVNTESNPQFHCDVEVPIEEVSGVPLTEDILVTNCGFERKQHLYSDRFMLGDFEIERQGKKYAYVIWGNEDAPFLTHYIGHCEYLHELQRLYKVIQKQELEVKL